MRPLFSTLRLFMAAPPRLTRRRAPRLMVDQLETRIQLSAPGVAALDGSGNNLAHPDLGKAGSELIRIAPAEYEDGISAPAGSDRPGARALSNALFAQAGDAANNDRQMSAFVYAWGQFVDHDLDLTLSADPAVAFNIPVPTGDPHFDPAATATQTIPLQRSEFNAATGTDASNPRQQTSRVTAWMDASMVYGSDATTAAALRTFSGGKLKTGAGNLLPPGPDGSGVMAGDIRAGENPELASLQALFLREHNRRAEQIAAANPGLDDEQIYQQARRLVIAEIQAITYNEFLPAFLGPYAPQHYRGYNSSVNPGIANEFSAAAFRFGHSLLGDDVEFLDNNGTPVREEMTLAESFFNTAVLRETDIDAVLKYLASDLAEEEDLPMVESVRNLLFGAPGSGGLDLAALDVQRGRDHGLADYNATRVAYGLPAVASFADITSDPALQAQLQELYGSVDNIDLFVGGLAEDHLAGQSLGPTFTRIIVDQFERTRGGDRFWYENVFSGRQLDELRHTTLAQVIRRNTDLTNLQDNVFFFRTSIAGQVFADVDASGTRDYREPGLGGRTVHLLDGGGVIVATTQTRPDGSYRFTNVGLGTYQVALVAAAGARLTTTPPARVQITRGQDVFGGNFGEAPPAGTPPAPTPQPTPTPPRPPIDANLPPPPPARPHRARPRRRRAASPRKLAAPKHHKAPVAAKLHARPNARTAPPRLLRTTARRR
jgi:peroxidase